MAAKTQRIILGMSVALLGVGSWWLTSSRADGDQGASNDAAGVRDGAHGGRIGSDNAVRGEGGSKGLAVLSGDKGRTPKFRKPDREGMEALTGVLGVNNVSCENWNALSFSVYYNSVAQKLSLLAIQSKF